MGGLRRFGNPGGAPIVAGGQMAAYVEIGGGGALGGQLFWGCTSAGSHGVTGAADGCINVTLFNIAYLLA